MAAKIDRSEKPSRALVARALREILAKLDPRKFDKIKDDQYGDITDESTREREKAQGERVDDMLDLADLKELREAVAEIEKVLDAILGGKGRAKDAA